MNAWIKSNFTLPAIISILVLIVSACGAFFSMRGDLALNAARAEAAHTRIGKVEAALERNTDKIMAGLKDVKDDLKAELKQNHDTLMSHILTDK